MINSGTSCRTDETFPLGLKKKVSVSFIVRLYRVRVMHLSFLHTLLLDTMSELNGELLEAIK